MNLNIKTRTVDKHIRLLSSQGMGLCAKHKGPTVWSAKRVKNTLLKNIVLIAKNT